MKHGIVLVLTLGLVLAACNDDPPAPAKPPPVKPTTRGAVSGRGPVPTGVPGEVPADELGHGGAALRLTLADSDTGKVTTGRVRVWRLGLPESFTFSAGDQIQATADVPTAGVLLKDLPPGRYRVEPVSQGRTRTDPPAFDLGEGEFPLDVFVHRLARVRVRAIVFRPDGSRFEDADRGAPGGDPRVRRRWSPAWAKPRRSRTSSTGGSRRRAGSGVVERLLADADGIDLGEWEEIPHDADDVGVVRLLPGPEWQQVYVQEDAVLGVPTTFVAVVASVKDVIARVTTSDLVTQPTADVAAGTESWSEAVAFPSPPPADAWRTVPIHVTVRIDGYETLTFDWSVATAGVPHVLVSNSSK